MSEHFFHLLLTILPFIGIVWLLARKKVVTASALTGFILVATLVTLLAFPVHYFHASHFQSQTHDCCIPSPVALTPFFEAPSIIQTFQDNYQLLSQIHTVEVFYSFNTRAPPIG
jgi:hypothetical protein